MFRKIAIIIILSACLLLFSNYINSKSTNTNYEEEYFNLEEQYYELEDEYAQAIGTCDEFSLQSLDLYNLNTEEVKNALRVIEDTYYQGYISDEDEYYEAYQILMQYYNDVFEASLDLQGITY